MPCSIKLRLHQARGLRPDRDEDGKYVEVSFNDHIRMSPKSTGSPENPVWGDSVMSIELTDDFQLQDYPLRLGVCSNETGPPDCGFVMINLEQILHSRPEMDPDEAVSMKGWFPLFDTMTGVRGRILVSIKMQFVGDQSYNDRFASSVGVRFFSIATPPQPGVFMVEQLLGLVEELRVVQDPEYNWRDLIRSDRSSNEERLRVFHNAAMRARRELGKQVQRLGANAVLGYREYVDLEGDATDRICIRAFGTAARITPSMAPTPMGLVHQSSYEVSRQGSRSPVRRAEGEFGLPMLSLLPANSGGAQSEALLSAVSMTRSSDEISVGGSAEGEVLQRGVLHSLDRLPVAERFAVCGVVAARAVKVFGSRTTQDNRESWWSDLREELLSHARCLGGDSIVGYREHVSITDEVITLSVMGTALRHLGSGASNLPDCSLAHASESRDDAGRLSKCAMCGEGMVPNILLATMDFPEGLPIVGRSELVEARVVRLKRKMAGEAHAQDLSEALPYLELELHKQLVHKMRVMGLNAAFGLRVEISHGSQLLLGVATATAVLVPALPRPPVVRAQPSRAPGGKAKPTGRDLVAKTPTSLRVPRQSSRAFRGAQQEAASTGHLSPPSAFGTARSNHPREMPRDNFKLTSKPGSDRRSSSFLMVCPARYRSPQRAWRRWLLRITCGILGEPASGSETYRGDRPMVASCVTFQAARPTCEALEHLNTAVACHLQRRKLDSSPTAADSFDWPTDKLQALQLTQLSLGRQRSAQELEAILMEEKNPGLERDNSKNLRHQDDRPQFLFEVDDEADEDLLMVLDDLLVPDGATLCTVDCPPDGTGIFQGRAPAEVELVGPTHKDGSCSVVYGVRRVDLFEDLGLDRSAVIGSAGVGSVQITAMLTKHLAKVLTEMYACMLFREMVRRGPAICCLAALSWRIAVLEDDVIELVLTGQLLATNAEPGKSTSQISQPSSLPLRPSVELQASQPAAVHAISEGPRGTTTNELLWHTLHLKQFRSHEPLQSIESEPPRDEGCHRRSDQEWVPDASVAEADKPVLVSALSSIPNCEVEQYCGFVTVHMIKETVNVTRQFESLQVFYHQFVAEALLTAKAHVLAVGGDALLGYRINNLFLREDKRRAYAVISISGDAAKLGFDPLRG